MVNCVVIVAIRNESLITLEYYCQSRKEIVQARPKYYRHDSLIHTAYYLKNTNESVIANLHKGPNSTLVPKPIFFKTHEFNTMINFYSYNVSEWRVGLIESFQRDLFTAAVELTKEECNYQLTLEVL